MPKFWSWRGAQSQAEEAEKDEEDEEEDEEDEEEDEEDEDFSYNEPCHRGQAALHPKHP